MYESVCTYQCVYEVYAHIIMRVSSVCAYQSVYEVYARIIMCMKCMRVSNVRIKCMCMKRMRVSKCLYEVHARIKCVYEVYVRIKMCVWSVCAYKVYGMYVRVRCLYVRVGVYEWAHQILCTKCMRVWSACMKCICANAASSVSSVCACDYMYTCMHDMYVPICSVCINV